MMKLFQSKLIESIHSGKSISNKVNEKPVYLLTKEEVISERDRIESLYDIKKQTKIDELRMRELASYSYKAFKTLLSDLK